jgi:hypothetical protein
VFKFVDTLGAATIGVLVTIAKVVILIAFVGALITWVKANPAAAGALFDKAMNTGANLVGKGLDQLDKLAS